MRSAMQHAAQLQNAPRCLSPVLACMLLSCVCPLALPVPAGTLPSAAATAAALGMQQTTTTTQERPIIHSPCEQACKVWFCPVDLGQHNIAGHSTYMSPVGAAMAGGGPVTSCTKHHAAMILKASNGPCMTSQPSNTPSLAPHNAQECILP